MKHVLAMHVDLSKFVFKQAFFTIRDGSDAVSGLFDGHVRVCTSMLYRCLRYLAKIELNCRPKWQLFWEPAMEPVQRNQWLIERPVCFTSK